MLVLGSAIASWISVMAAIYGFFPKLDKRLRPETKEALSRFLNGKADPSDNWATLFVEQFDRIFKVRVPSVNKGWRLPRPNFGRVCIASVLTVAVLWLVWFALLPAGAVLSLEWLEDRIFMSLVVIVPESGTFEIPLAIAISGPVVLNILPDYVSLIETRWVLQRITKTTLVAGVGAWLVLDAFLTFAIFASIFFLFHAILHVIWAAVPTPFISPLNYLDSILLGFWFNVRLIVEALEMPLHTADYSYYGVYLYSTYLTSVWLWLFLLGAGLARLLGLFPFVLGIADRWFNFSDEVNNQPLAVIGYLLMGFILLATAIGIAAAYV